MGLAPEDLEGVNPGLVHCSITGFGTGEQGVGMAGFDQNAQGMSGLMSVTGTEATGPLRVGVPVADSVTGLVASFAISARLLERERTGRGGPVSTSLLQSASFLLTYQAQKYLSGGVVAGREGNDHPLLFPQGTFATADGHMTIASGNERMWRQLCGALGLEDLAEDPRFADNAGRLQHKHELRHLLETALAGGTTAHWIDHVGRAGVPCGSVLGIDELFEHPVAEELGLAEEVEHSTLGPMRVLGRPAVTSEGSGWLRSAPPRLGEHSAEVLGELGIGAPEVGDLLARGVVGAPAAPARG
jgi:crotonobetainyl-CoA:carnitine CoA-transferase CaiB-like acyl-CoA transferase